MSLDKNNARLVALKKYFLGFKDTSTVSLFAEDSKRTQKYRVELDNLYYDYSFNHIDDKALKLLLKFAQEAGLSSKIADLFTGKKVNYTENRAALHHVIRTKKSYELMIEGENFAEEVHNDMQAVLDFAEKIRTGEIKSSSGDKFINIINIGIGGSDLGPKMAIRALDSYKKIGLNFRFLSNIDGEAFEQAIRGFAPEHTLVVVTSKTFTTLETLKNFEACKNWILEKLGKDALTKHFVGITAHPENAKAQGLKYVFKFPVQVGGRYSVFSSVGLSLMIAVGASKYAEFLEGARMMDEHFQHADFGENIPVLMGLLEFWHTYFFETTARCVVAYDQRLEKLPDYFAQLICESNGKSVDSLGNKIKYQTSPVVFGGVGTDVQHSFFQMLHQGTQNIPCDFIGAIKGDDNLGDHHKMLIANMLGQALALMQGRNANETKEAIIKAGKIPSKQIDAQIPFEVFDGNISVNMLLVDNVSPKTLGMLIALYEHKTFTESVLWDINAFDQFGVELGKKIATQVLGCLKDKSSPINMEKGEGIIEFVRNKME
jgi:glucose-6-phosphate isomerase